jgi:Tfp pilus assembly protein PilZ
LKRLLIGDCREKLLSTLEVILKHWGYRVLVSSRVQQLSAFLEEISPDLLIMGSRLLSDQAALREAVERKAATGACPLIVLGEQDAPNILKAPHENLNVPLDIFSLFELTQKYLEKYPRKNLRLAIKLPGMLCKGEACHLTEVLSLSTQGLFIKTSVRMEQGDSLRVVFPLLGAKKELELDGQVLYCIQPHPENNYLQGIGLGFNSLGKETSHTLQTFIENRFLGELSATQRGTQGLAKDQIQRRSAEVTLRLIRTS